MEPTFLIHRFSVFHDVKDAIVDSIGILHCSFFCYNLADVEVYVLLEYVSGTLVSY